ncbi:hypothetical protein [Mangrovibacterium sp.]|uniref:hypothetical protein n=1 Tax=Mangrovibacterium sp. TaxID=1961364 RepID=UPI0035674F41
MKNLSIILLLMFFSLASFAQIKDRMEEFERYKSNRVSYMTEKLQLTPEEAQKFWPIYNEYDQSRISFHQKKKELESKVRDNYNKLSDAELTKLNSEQISLIVKEAELAKSYNEKFLKVLPVKKVILISPTESEFRFKVIREYRQREKENKK